MSVHHLEELNGRILKSIRSIIKKKTNFYGRAISKFLCIMHNQFVMFYSLYQEYELKILCVSVKLADLGIYFIEKHAQWRLHDLQYYWGCNISVVFLTLGPNAAKIIDYVEKCFKRKLRKIKFPAKNSAEADLYLLQEWSYWAPNICHILEIKHWFFLRLKASNITNCIEKCFKQKLYKI